MRVKKQKRNRRVLRFYSACFGFREPFKILCDGTFVHHLIANDLLPANDALYRLLGARTLLFTTKCIIDELKSLGKSHATALQAANELTVANCDHERRVGAAVCVEEVVGKSDGKSDNAEHFFVATQDTDFRSKLREVPGIPVIYGLRNSLCLDQLSIQERDYAKYIEEKRTHIGYPEYQKLLNWKASDKSESDTQEHGSSADEVMERLATKNTDTTRQRLGVADKTKFKRKKGPNPLSYKKKKPKENSSVTQHQATMSVVGEGSIQSAVGSSSKQPQNVEINELGLPISDNSTKIGHWMGALVRTHVPISFKSWHVVPKIYKEDLWNKLKNKEFG